MISILDRFRYAVSKVSISLADLIRLIQIRRSEPLFTFGFGAGFQIQIVG